MKIFSWMQTKLNGKQVTKNPNTVGANHHMNQATSKEEFSDWPQSLLAIGTFGLSNLRPDPEPEAPHLQIPTPEEEDGELHEELISYLDIHVDEEEETETHPSETTVCEDLLSNRGVRLQRSISGMFSIGKEIVVDKKNNVIKKKSLTFLLNKIFKSRNRLNLVRDSLPDPTFEKSRMEKILRAILNKKIHPQSSTTKAISDKYLVRKKDMYIGESDDEDDNEGSIWVKTDSEYIVLEI